MYFEEKSRFDKQVCTERSFVVCQREVDLTRISCFSWHRVGILEIMKYSEYDDSSCCHR